LFRPVLNPLQDLLQVRTGLEQGVHGIDVALAHCEEQRREPGLEPDVQVGPSFEQGMGHRGVPLRRGPHEGRLVALFDRVGVGAVGQQCAHRAETAGPGRRHPVDLRHVHIGAAIEQAAHQRHVAPLSRVGHRSVIGGRRAGHPDGQRHHQSRASRDSLQIHLSLSCLPFSSAP